MTHPANHETRARAILRTWGARCNRLLFMSSAADPVLDTVVLPLSGAAEARSELWLKTSAAYRYVHRHHAGEFDWVLRADDDTYVVVENLRHMLHGRDADEALAFGCRFRLGGGLLYMSGGAGIVLSRRAVQLVVERGLEGGECTQAFGGVDDVALGEWGSDVSQMITVSKRGGLVKGIVCLTYNRPLSGRGECDHGQLAGRRAGAAIPAV